MICLRRMIVCFAMAAIGASTVAIIVLSVNGGFVRRVAARFLRVPLLYLTLLVLLLMTETCDRPENHWTSTTFGVRAALTVGLVICRWDQRWVDGPQP